MATESWLPVVGGGGKYMVSNVGRVRSVDRVVTDTRGITKRVAGKILKPANVGKYLGASLYVDRLSFNRGVHIMVLEAFVAPRPCGMVANHKDGDKHNNHLDNLEWVSPRENNLHAVNAGLLGYAKLSRQKADDIIAMHNAGVSTVDIAAKMGVHPSTARDVWSGVSWKNPLARAAVEEGRKGNQP